jgi:hypothetical protein
MTALFGMLCLHTPLFNDSLFIHLDELHGSALLSMTKSGWWGKYDTLYSFLLGGLHLIRYAALSGGRKMGHRELGVWLSSHHFLHANIGVNGCVFDSATCMIAALESSCILGEAYSL